MLPVFLSLTLIAILTGYTTKGKEIWEYIDSMLVHGKTPLPNSWFIYAIIYVYVAFFISAMIAKNAKGTGFLFTLGIIAYCMTIALATQWGAYWYLTIFAVNVGYFMAIYEKRIDSLSLRYRIASITAMGGVISVIFCTSRYLPPHTHIGGEVLHILHFLNLTLALYLIVRLLGCVKWKCLKWVAVFSMELYLVHGLIIDYLAPFFDTINDVLLIMLVYLLSVPIAWMLHWITISIAPRKIIKE